MAGKTTYTHEARYEISDHASGALHKLEKAFHLVGEKSEKGRERVREFGRETILMGLGAVGVGYGIHALGEKIIDVGKEFDAAQKKIAGTLFATAKWGSAVAPVDRAASSMRMAGEAMEDIEKIETRFVQPLDDLQLGYDQLALSLGRANVNIKDLPEYLLPVAAAAKVAGTSVEMAGNLFGKFVLTGAVPMRGALGKMMGGLKGMAKATAEHRLDALMAKLKQMPGGADVMATGFAASIQRIEIAFNRLTRKLSAPLFAELTKEIDAWSHKLLDVDEAGKTLLDTYAKDLLAAFNTMKDVVGVIAAHWQEIAIAMGAMKTASMVGSGVKLGGGLLGILSGAGAAEAGGAAKMLGGFGAQLSIATAGLVALGIAANEFANYVDKQHDITLGREAPKGAGGSYDESLKALAAGNNKLAFAQLNSTGLLTQTGKVTDPFMFKQQLKSDPALMGGLADTMGINRDFSKATQQQQFAEASNPGSFQASIANAIIDGFEKLNQVDALSRYAPPGYNMSVPTTDPTKLNSSRGNAVVNIHNLNLTQDFKEADPDNVYVAFTSELERHVVAPLTSNASPTAVRP